MNNKRLEELSNSLRKGDESALAGIYQETNRLVFSIALGILKDQQLAEDIMQETYLKVKSSIDYYQKGTNFGAWIAQVAKNLALMEYRRRKKEVLVDPIEKNYMFGSVSYEFKEVNPTLAAALEILDENEKEVLLLHINSDLKHREIATILNKPLGTVLWLYNRAIKKMRNYIESKGGLANDKQKTSKARS
jgi:RNA polymerase sigma-70 factor (ECF subfamily)